MKLNYLTNCFAAIQRRLFSGILCLMAIAFVWQGGFLVNHAIAAPFSPMLATDMGNQVKDKAREDASSAKGFIRDAANQVEKTASQNANKIGQATDGSNSFLERKAKLDAATIQRRAEADAARTQNAVDTTKNAVERTVDNIKDAFSS